MSSVILSQQQVQDLDWVTLYDYLHVTSKAPITKKTNNFYESFYPLKYKKSEIVDPRLIKVDRDGFLGDLARYVDKIIYVWQLFLNSEIEICVHEEMIEQIQLYQLFLEMEKQNLEDSLRLESSANWISEIAVTTSHKAEQLDQKSFLEIKIFHSLIRFWKLFKQFRVFYTMSQFKEYGDSIAIDKLYKLLRSMTETTCNKVKSLVKLFPEIGEVLVKLLELLCIEIPQNNIDANSEISLSLRLRKLLPVICNKQKNLLVLIADQKMRILLNEMVKMTVPRDMVENYIRCETQINNIIAEEENVIEPILLHEHLRGTSRWKQKAYEQLVNLKVQKLTANPPKIMQMEEFKRSKGFPLADIL